MKKVFIALLFAGAIYFSMKNSGGKVDFPMTVMSENTGAKSVPTEQRQNVILFTGTSWCGACMALDQQVVSTPQWQEFTSKEINFRSYDIPANQSSAPEVARQMMSHYGVRSFPTMIVIDSKGKKLSQMVGSGPPVENYKYWIRQHENLKT